MKKHHHDFLWQAKVAYWIAQRLPYVLIKEPERLLVGFFGCVTGVVMLVPIYHPPSIDHVLHPPMVWLWAMSFLIGGAAKIVAIVMLANASPRDIPNLNIGRLLERLGASLLALGCTVYAAVVLDQNGIPGIMTFFMFLGIALTNMIRLVVSVANGYIQGLHSRGA